MSIDYLILIQIGPWLFTLNQDMLRGMKVQITQIKSAIGTTQAQKDNLRSLRLGRIGNKAVFDQSDKAFLGRLKVVKHLLKIQEVK
jgi:ribosomal protein L30